MSKTKESLIADLQKFNVALTGTESFRDLQALLKKAKADAKAAAKDVKSTEGTSATAPAPVAAPKGKAKHSVHVKTTNGTRVFSKDEHGADFQKTADEFVKTNEPKVLEVAHDVAPAAKPAA